LSTTPSASLPSSPTIPLSDDVRAAYDDLYGKLEAEYQGNPDTTARLAIGPARDNVKSVLTQDNACKFSQDTALFRPLLSQINNTNTSLKTLQGQITATESHFQTAGDILGAVSNVLSLLGV
jgi:hypothetical protein